MNAESKKPRLLYLDNIKVLFTILVIFQHVRITFGGGGLWYYLAELNKANPVDPVSTILFILFSLIGGLFQASLLGLFFLMGGYFTPKSYDRKGVHLFWKERFIRLGIPLLLYSVLVDPIIKYSLAVLGILPWNSYPEMQGSLLDFYLSNFTSLIGFGAFLTAWGPLWYIAALICFTAGYTLFRQINFLQQYIPNELPIPKSVYLLLIAIFLGCVTFLIRIVFPMDHFPLGLPFAFMLQYVMMFSIGVIALRYNWFEKMTKDNVKFWVTIIAITSVLFYLYVFLVLGTDSYFIVFLGGPTFPAFLFALADNIITMGMIFVLIPIFHAKFNKQGKILQNLSSSAFHMYLVHPPVLVIVSLAFATIVLFPIIKLAIILPLTILLCYLVSYLWGWINSVR